ncbi:MAG: hypothetical protein QW622_00885 [Candidatus Pacearchaeota archaeon]
MSLKLYNKYNKYRKSIGSTKGDEIINDLRINRVELCLICQEAIFTPICPKCLTKEVNTWAIQSLKGKKYEKLRHEIGSEMLRLSKYDFPSTKCIKCKGNVFICPYCFTESIYEIIKKSKLKNKKRIIEDFLIHFNFDFDHTGYIKELI